MCSKLEPRSAGEAQKVNGLYHRKVGFQTENQCNTNKKRKSRTDEVAEKLGYAELHGSSSSFILETTSERHLEPPQWANRASADFL
jgi:hypothetical protein